MKHDEPTSLYGYDPAFWKARKRAAWLSVAILAMAVLGVIAVERWPDALQFAFFVAGFLAATSLCIFIGEMWDNRRFHPWISERFHGPRK